LQIAVNEDFVEPTEALHIDDGQTKTSTLLSASLTASSFDG